METLFKGQTKIALICKYQWCLKQSARGRLLRDVLDATGLPDTCRKYIVTRKKLLRIRRIHFLVYMSEASAIRGNI